MNLNGKSIVAIRKLSTSKYLAGKKGEKKEKREKIVYGITLPAELLKVARFSAGKYVELDASPGRITVTFIAVKEIEQQKRDERDVKEEEWKGRGPKPARKETSKAPKGKKSGKSAVPGKVKNKAKKVEKKSRKASKSVKNTPKTAPKGVEKGKKVPEVVEMGVKTD